MVMLEPGLYKNEAKYTKMTWIYFEGNKIINNFYARHFILPPTGTERITRKETDMLR